MGGFDVFVSRLNESGEWGEAMNIGYPINSPSDDNSLIVAKDGRTAYFASTFFNEDRNDLDLYTFDLPQESRSLEVAYMQGLITDSKTNNPIKADIELVNLKSGKSYKSSESDLDGNYVLCLPSDSEYALTVNKNKYLFYSENIKLEHEGSILVKNFKQTKII